MLENIPTRRPMENHRWRPANRFYCYRDDAEQGISITVAETHGYDASQLEARKEAARRFGCSYTEVLAVYRMTVTAQAW